MEAIGLSVWHVWALLALVFIIIEFFTTGFAVMCFSFGAIAAAICSACGLSLLWQLGMFALFSALAFIFVRPAVLKFLYKRNKDKEVKTNADAIIGRTARVTEIINNANNTGRVAIDGDDWKAISLENEVLPIGTLVEVVSRDSIILSVKKKNGL